MSVVFCPQCGRQVSYSERAALPEHFPFCSERCHLIDLGKWFEEEFRIEEPLGPAAPADEDWEP